MNGKLVKELIGDFVLEEDGIGVVEIILILVILIGLVVIFKDKMTELVNSIFNSITKKTSPIIK